MTIHELKTKSEYLESIISGTKTFEIRKNDRNYKVGDILVLKGWENNHYTGKTYYVIVTYILKKFDGLKKNYIIMAVKHFSNGGKQE